MKENVTLIGMPGSGKSYIGKKLSENFGYKLVELDKLMEEQFKLPLQQILDKIGEDSFLSEQEKDAILYTTDQEKIVVSPGGSIVYSDKAMNHLKSISKIIYLKTKLETIRHRVAEAPRGIVGLNNKTLEELYEERTSLYEQWSDLQIDAERSAEDIITDIKTSIN